MHQMDLTGFYRKLHPNNSESFSKVESWDTRQICTHSKRLEIILYILSDHSVSETDSKQISSKYTNSWWLNNSILYHEWAKEEIKKKNLKKIPGTQ